MVKKGLIVFFVFVFFVVIVFFGFNISGMVFYDSANFRVEIPENFKNLNPGDKVWFTTYIMNLASERRIDVTLRYLIVDFENGVLESRSETVAVETQASFVSNLIVPDYAKEGRYRLVVEMVFDNEVVRSADAGFYVFEEKGLGYYFYNYQVFILVILFVVFILFCFFVFRSYFLDFFERYRLRIEVRRIISEKIRNKRVSRCEIDGNV